MRNKIEKVIDKEIRPSLILHGGGVELIDVDEKEGVVTVRLSGACAGCPMSQMTSIGLIERVLKEKIPEIRIVKTI